MGRPARPLHDAGNNRSAERGSNLHVARRGNLTISAKPARERENVVALTPLPGTRSLPRTPTSNRPGQTPTCNDRSKSRNPLGYFALRCLSPCEGVLAERMLRIRGYGSGNFVVSSAAGSFARYLTRPSTISTGRFGFSHAPWAEGIVSKRRGWRPRRPVVGRAGDRMRCR